MRASVSAIDTRAYLDAGRVYHAMRLTDDLTSPRAIFWKGWLFLVLGVLAAGGLLALDFRWEVLALLAIATWAFCRWYYFMFYVIEHYVDPSFKFAGLGSFLRYALKRENQDQGVKR